MNDFLYDLSQKGVCWDPYLIPYSISLLSVISKYHGFRSHLYVDNTQIYLSFLPELTSVFSSIESCITNIFP